MKFLDLFAGIGGFRHAMILAGHTPVGWCEIDKYAQQSYRAIFDTEGEWVSDDITKVDTNGLPDFDCLCGGFPCQAFSIAGQRRGFEDTRGTLFFEIARIAEAKRPKILFLENVKGLFSHDSGRTFATILLALDELGYDVQWQVLNAKDFGVPQNRERVFIVGHLRRTTRPEVFPISIANIENDKKGQSRGIIRLLGYSNGRQGYQQGSSIVSSDGLYGTLDTLVEVKRDIIWDGKNFRKPTPLECWRMMGRLDKHFYIAKDSGVSESELYKQAGNSVVVDVVYAVAERLPI